MPTDTERLDWLAQQDGAALISNDFTMWTVSQMGMQEIPDGIEEGPTDLSTSFFVEKKDWHPSIREAIDAAIADNQ